MFQFCFVYTGLRHTIQFNRQTTLQRCLNAAPHPVHCIESCNALKYGSGPCIQTDVHAVQSGIQQCGELLFQQNAIGGQCNTANPGAR